LNKVSSFDQEKEKGTPSKFSFLDSMKGGGKKRTLSTVSSQAPPPAKIQKPSNQFDGLDFVKLSSFGSPSFSPPKSSFNLIELEKLRKSAKKNERRSLTPKQR